LSKAFDKVNLHYGTALADKNWTIVQTLTQIMA